MNKNIIIGLGLIALAFVIFKKNKKSNESTSTPEEKSNACGCGA